MLKSKVITALFIALIIILVVNPKIVNNIYSSILGRVVLIIGVVFLASNNLTFGLLVVLAIISALNQFGPITEGMETIGEDNVVSTGEQKVLTKDAVKRKISEIKAEAEADGIDKEDIKNAIMSKDSNVLPVDPNSKSSEEVNAFKQSMLTNKSSLTEGFCPCASPF